MPAFIEVIEVIAVLATALLFGGMTLFAGGLAAFLFSVLPVAEARRLIRAAFPPFYLLVMATAAIAALAAMPLSSMAAGLLLTIAVTTWPTRQFLMPAINHASDTGARQRFHLLHGLSVIITLGHIVVSGWVLVTFAT